MNNSALLAQQLLDAKGAIQCFGEPDIVAAVALLLSNPREKELLVKAGRAFVEKNKGALERTLALIDTCVSLRKARD